MKIPGILFLALSAFMLVQSCQEEEVPALPVPGVHIDGDYLEPSEVFVFQDSASLVIQFLLPGIDLRIITTDTVAARYLLRPELEKGTASDVLPGRLVLFDGERAYLSDSGWLELEKQGKKYSGTFESVAMFMLSEDDYLRVEITDGAFRDVVPVVLD